MQNDRIINQLRDQHRVDMLHAAEGDRLLREARTTSPAESHSVTVLNAPGEGISHRLRLFLHPAARQEIGAYRLALCHCILEQFHLGAISIEEAEHRLSQLW